LFLLSFSSPPADNEFGKEVIVMIFEPADSSLAIAGLIVKNAKYLTENARSSLESETEKNGYIDLIEALLITENSLYQEMQLNDDFRFEAVIDKAKSFSRIARSALRDIKVTNNNLERMQGALARLEDSYASMKSYHLYADTNNFPDC
jgi:hypothetical protein